MGVERQIPELETIARCEVCGGDGAVDSGGVQPWGEAIFVKCGHCNGTGKEPPPEEMCQLFEMCELQGVHPELKAAVGALILRCMDAELKLRRLPADWFEDSSLETWFPLTAERIADLAAEVAQKDAEIKRLRRIIEGSGASNTGQSPIAVEERP